MPAVMRHCALLFSEPMAWMEVHAATTLHSYITSATIGELFWPRAHVDDDWWYTVLLCLDPTGAVIGGEFAFPAHGHILCPQHGDIIIYNPRHSHGTTEFQVSDASHRKMYIALYCKGDAVKASCISKARVDAIGPQPMKI